MSACFIRSLAASTMALTVTIAHPQSEADSLWGLWGDPQQHDTVRMRALDYLAFDHYLFTRPDSAYLIAALLLDLAKRTEHDYFQAIAYNTQAASLQVRGDFPRAVQHYRAALGRLKAMGDLRRQSMSHSNLGSILDDLGEKDLALAHYDTCVDLSIRKGNKHALAEALINSASIYRERGDTTEAMTRFERSLAIADSIGHQQVIALAHGNIGKLVSLGGQHSEGLAHLQRALAIAEAMDDRRLQGMFHREIGEVYLRLGQLRQAATAGERSLSIARRSGMAVEMYGSAGLLHRTYKRLGDLPKALAMHELYAAMADTLHNEKGREEMIRANMRLHFREQAVADSLNYVADLTRVASEREIARITNRTQRRLFLGGMVLVLVLGGTITWTVMERRRRRAWYEREQAIVHERMRIASDMHDDMGSGLSALRMRGELAQRSETDPQKQQLLNDLTGQATELITNMRQIIWAMHSEQGDLADTLDHCADHARAYLKEHGLEFVEERAADMPSPMLSPQQRRSIFLVVKEALHNTVKHASATRVLMKVAWDDGLVLSLQDNGKGMGTPHNGRSGRGLTNMAHRMQDIGGRFAAHNDQGLRIEVRVPLEVDDATWGPNARHSTP